MTPHETGSTTTPGAPRARHDLTDGGPEAEETFSMSPRGRPESIPHSLSASGLISVTPRSSHPTDSSHCE